MPRASSPDGSTPRSSRRTGLLRHPADVRTIAYLTLHGVATALAWRFPPANAALLALTVAALGVSSWIVAVIAHNTIHCAVFHSRALNRAFRVWVSLSYGFPVSEFVPGHNASHHRHMQRDADLMRTTRLRFGWNLLNLLAFAPAVVAPIWRANMAFATKMRRTSPAWFTQLCVEAAFVWATKVALFALDWRKALLFVVVPHLYALWGITTVNFVQHDGCDEEHPVNHSRNFVGRAFNWLTFNNGFHAAHHDEPGLHWSLLPARHHERFHGAVHPSLEQRSLLVYCLRTFVLPGRRLRYSGERLRPVASAPPPRVIDAESIEEVDEVFRSPSIRSSESTPA